MAQGLSTFSVCSGCLSCHLRLIWNHCYHCRTQLQWKKRLTQLHFPPFCRHILCNKHALPRVSSSSSMSLAINTCLRTNCRSFVRRITFPKLTLRSLPLTFFTGTECHNRPFPLPAALILPKTPQPPRLSSPFIICYHFFIPLLPSLYYVLGSVARLCCKALPLDSVAGLCC